MEEDIGQKVLAFSKAANANEIGLRLIHAGDFAHAEEVLADAIKLIKDFPATVDAERLAAALYGNLATVYIRTSKLKEAIELLELQSGLAQETEDLQGYSNALNSMAICRARLGDIEEAQKLFEQRLAIAQKLDDKKGEGNTLNNLAVLYLDRKQYGPAIGILRQRVALAHSINDHRGEATSLINLGRVYEQTSDLDAAKEAWTNALAVMRPEGDDRIPEVEAMIAQLQS
jgi:tetratricopeptide (TPR) repeat protein